MLDLNKISGFEWDEGNINKIFEKHGISTNEVEKVFLDPDQLVLDDIKHSQKEERFNIIGKDSSEDMLFIAFTIRGDKIRVISARIANAKERRLYEKKT